jgi:hypothetical protein
VQPQKPINSWIEVLDSERVFVYAHCASNVQHGETLDWLQKL